MQIADIKNNSTVLVGTYRTEKAQQDWILGLNPMRQEILYNVRYNQDIFAARNGGITSLSKPDFVLLYDYHDLKKTGHLFECLSQSIVNEDEMHFMQYPEPNGSYVVCRLGEEVDSTYIDIETIINEQITREPNHIEGAPFVISIEDVRRVIKPETIVKLSATCEKRDVIRFIDLFAGIGGIRCGLEQAIRDRGFEPVCVFTSEIKPYAVRVLHDNHPAETITGDITKVKTKDIPDFDILCAGFPCQAFSSAGKRKGFASPMMWGHYARDYQRSGVCIELDSSKIKPAQKGTTIYKGKVKYKTGLIATHIGGVNAELEDAAQLFVKKNRKQLFLIKHLHWRPENEYRCVSKNCEYLDISEAITSVYVLWEDNVTLQAVRRIITDSTKVNFLEVGGLKTLKLKEFNLFEYEELQEEMRQWNFQS